MGMQDKIGAVLTQGVQRGDVPGVVAMVANREGVIYEGAFGERALGSGTAMTTDTVGWIASMTKAITSVAALQCVERGLLKLDEPAKNVCPQLGQVGVLTGFDANGQPTTRPPKRDITLRQLLTHSAGFSYEIWNTDMQKVQAAQGIPSVTECKNKALTLPLLFDPGEAWEYGINIDWAGKMIEAASGQTLGHYLKENILGPLGMNSTAFRISDDMRQRLASPHLRGPDGQLAVFPLRDSAGARVRDGRWRPVWHGRGLPALFAHGAQRRAAGRRAHPHPRGCGVAGREPHGGLPRLQPQSRHPLDQ